MATKRMTEAADKKSDKAKGIKENSKRDLAKDKRMGVAQAPAKRPKRGGVGSTGPQD